MASADLSGRRFGAYQVHQRIGVGGMGEVYRASDTRLGRDVAIKIIHPEFTGDPQRLERFEREARVLASLNHPHIGAIFGLEEADGLRALVLELVDGETLAERIARGALPLAESLNIARQIAEALETAHELGIIHRDLKPANVKVTPADVVKVLDFGLAKAAGEASVPDLSSSPTRTSEQTRAGVILGTPAYMSPEQARGRVVDKRTDIWAFGCLLYEMLTGRIAFQGDTSSDTIVAVLEREPDWTALPASTPANIRRLLQRCFEKDARRRLRDIGEARLELEATTDDGRATLPSTQPVLPAPVMRRRSVAWSATALAVLIAAGALAWWAAQRPATAVPLQAFPLTTLPGIERHPSFAPDGNHVVFNWNGPRQDNPDVYVQQIGSGSPLRLTTDAGNDYTPAWSPDGRWIAFLRSQGQTGVSELRLVPPLGGPERKLVDINLGTELLIEASIAWCPDSTCVIVTDSARPGDADSLVAVSLGSGEKTPLTRNDATGVADVAPAVSPDGRWLVFSRNRTPTNGDLYALELGKTMTPAGEPTLLQLGALNGKGRDVEWMPDGKGIVFAASGGLWTLAVPGPGAPVRVAFVGEDGMMPAISRPHPGQPSRLVYVRSYRDENIWRIDTAAPGESASSPPYASISSTKADLTPQFSPDGRRVAFSSARSGSLEIWTAESDGANAVQLTAMGATPGYARWSPDGNAVVFHSNPTGHAAAYSVPAAGGEPRAITSDPDGAAFPSFSRDGRWTFISARGADGQPSLWKFPSGGGDRIAVTTRPALMSMMSQDGAFVYFTDRFDRPSTLWRVPASGGAETRVLDGVLRSNFAVLDGGIYYIDQLPDNAGGGPNDRPSVETRLQYFDFATSTSKTVARNLGPVGLGLTASSDGRTILFTRLDASIDDLMLVENFH